jgi:hypothetical protein
VGPTLSACSTACAHRTALIPSNEYRAGESLHQATYADLEDLNLIVLTILAAEIDAQSQPRICNLSHPDLTHLLLDDEQNLQKHLDRDDKHQFHDQIPKRSQTRGHICLDAVWTCVAFECLDQFLFYREARFCESADPAIIWRFGDMSYGIILDDGVIDASSYKSITVKGSLFIHNLSSSFGVYKTRSEDVQDGAPFSMTRPMIKRRKSAPKLGSQRLIKDHSVDGKRISEFERESIHSSLRRSTMARESNASVCRSNSEQVEIEHPLLVESSQLAGLVRSKLVTRASLAGNELVQTVTGITGTVATSIGSAATVALWMKKTDRKQAEERSSIGDIELEELSSRQYTPESYRNLASTGSAANSGNTSMSSIIPYTVAPDSYETSMKDFRRQESPAGVSLIRATSSDTSHLSESRGEQEPLEAAQVQDLPASFRGRSITST